MQNQEQRVYGKLQNLTETAERSGADPGFCHKGNLGGQKLLTCQEKSSEQSKPFVAGVRS